MSVLIDTDVLIEYLRGNEVIVDRIMKEYEKGRRLHFSPVTRAEVAAGLRRGEESITERLFGLMTCLTITEETGKRAGAYLKSYGPSHAVEIADALIAATAYENDVLLWTMNKKHYPMKELVFYSE
jgi:hypothetical protein